MKDFLLFIRANIIALIIVVITVLVVTIVVIRSLNAQDNKFPTEFYLDTDVVNDNQCVVFITDDYGEIVCIDNNCWNHTNDTSVEAQREMIKFIQSFNKEKHTDVHQLSIDYQCAMDNIERTGLIE